MHGGEPGICHRQEFDCVRPGSHMCSLSSPAWGSGGLGMGGGGPVPVLVRVWFSEFRHKFEPEPDPQHAQAPFGMWATPDLCEPSPFESQSHTACHVNWMRGTLLQFSHVNPALLRKEFPCCTFLPPNAVPSSLATAPITRTGTWLGSFILGVDGA